GSAPGPADLPVPRLPSLYESPTPRAAFRHGDTDTEEIYPAIDTASPIRRAPSPVPAPRVVATPPATLHASPVTSPPAPEAVDGLRVAPAVAGNDRSRRAVVGEEPADVRPAAH